MLSVSLCPGPGLMIVSGERPCIKIDDVPIGWEFFEERGWEVLRVPLPKYVESKFT